MQNRFRYLLDAGERPEAILALREWIADDGPGPIVATTVERNLAAPLRWYLGAHPQGRTDTDAAAALLLKSEDIAHRLRHSQTITPEQIDAVERAWLEMQAAIGLGWVAIAGKARATLSEAGARGAKAKHKNQAATIEAAHARILRRAKLMRTGYSKTEALNILEKDFPGYSRRQIANIVSSVFPPKRRRATPSA